VLIFSFPKNPSVMKSSSTCHEPVTWIVSHWTLPSQHCIYS